MDHLFIKFGRYLPLLTPAIVILVLIICFILTKTNDIYVGGLDWPYFSDMGRDSPNYYVFASGLTICGVFLMIIWYCNCKHQALVLKDLQLKYGKITGHTHRTNIAVGIIGMLSAVGLPILSIFDTSNYPDLHNYAAYWFFLLEAIAILLNTFVSFKIYRGKSVFLSHQRNDHTPSEESFSEKKVFKWQISFVTLFWIAFLIYLPIGLAVNCSFERLSIDKCISLELGTKYCTDTVRHNSTSTVLWNYDKCFGTNQMRSIAQLVSILTLIGYSVSYTWHDYKAGAPSDDFSSPIVT